jgi:eukaryotic-like serine/threonine-protein kinase
MAGDGEFRMLGPYVLLRTSGAGGMGRIDLGLRAQPDGIGKLYVLKRMHAELRSQEQEARFRREANIALQLSHDAIAQTVGVEEIDGELLLLQEPVHGVDLRLLGTRLAAAGEVVPLAISVHVVSEVARALAYAHAFGDLGIVHRDVTPDNVMLAFSGEVKLVDFGIARSNADATLTSTGLIVGRPTYTAPEVWEGTKADRRADVYSLGVVLWQLLTGRRLEDASLSGEPLPVPSALNPAVPAPLDAVTLRALADAPDQRYQTAGELQDALRPFLPLGFTPKTALAELVARHFDADREHRMLADDVERATRFLAAAAAPEIPRPSKPPAPAPRAARERVSPPNGRMLTLGAAIGVACFAVVAVVFLGLRHSTSRSTAALKEVTAAAPAQTSPSRDAPRPPAIAVPAPGSGAREELPPSAQTAPPRAHQIATSARRAPASTKPARPAQTVAPEELLARAQEKFDLGETESALALARQAAGAGARAPAHVLMGKVMMSERRYDEAEREFAEAVRLDPADTKAARLLALVRETRSGRQ